MSTLIDLSSVKLPDGTCFPGSMQDLLDLIVDSMQAELPDSVTLFNFGPNTPPTEREDQPWIKTSGTGQLLGIYTFTNGNWEPQDPPFTTGDILMFSGSEGDIQPPWYVCNGQTIQSIQNNQITNQIVLPDLRGRFIVGTGQRVLPTGSSDTATDFATGQTGGEETHVLTVPELPAHAHNLGALGSLPTAPPDYSFIDNSVSTLSDLVTGMTGGDGAHNNLPPYYALAFKMFISREDAGLT